MDASENEGSTYLSIILRFAFGFGVDGTTKEGPLSIQWPDQVLKPKPPHS